jgi:spore germination protein GerM
MVVSRANVLTVAGLLALLCLVLVTAPRWTRLLSRPVPGAEEAGEDAGASAAAETEPVVERQINVKLYFQANDRPGLVQEERSLAYSPDLGHQLRTVVEELVKGPRQGLAPTLAPETKVRDVMVNARGVAFVSLSKEAAEKQAGGSTAEMMAVYSVVNSLAANFPAVKRVQILVEDRPAQTFAGHVDLLKPLPPDMTLLASSTLEPVASAPPVAPSP